MNKTLFQKALPHIIAVIVFLVIAVIYCKPALDGQVLQQSDITGWKGAIQQSVEYAKTHDGKYPLWTNSLFSGMPAFQVGYSANNFIPGIVHTIMTLGLPAPIQYFFLACICFYILSVVLKVNPYVGIMGALGFAYATYNPIIIGVGHVTKMLTMAYMPALLGSLILIYERKYWLGATLTALFSCTMIAQNHPQIAYYFFITVAIMTIFYVINWIKAKDYKHLAKAFAFTAVAAIVGLMTNAVSVMSTYEYQKETIRGGHSSLTDTTIKNDSPKDGLDKTYAFEYSLGITEPLVMMVPRMYGGSSDSKDLDPEKSKAVESMQQVGQETVQQIAQQTGLNMQQMVSTYWGGLGGVGTSGPPYAGAIICFLAILSFFVLDGKHKWWALTAIVLTIMMSWGSYFKELNNFIFDHFPLYNKFRAPSMILVIPQLLLPMLAALGVNAYINTADKKSLWPKFKKGLIATGILFVLIFLIYFSADFLRSSDKDLLKQIRGSGSTQLAQIFDSFYDGLAADRKGLFMSDIWRSLGFILLAAVTLFLLIRKTISSLVATILLSIFVLADLISVDSKYLNKEDYEDKADNEAHFTKTSFDDAILADTSFFRVFNISGAAYQENMTSYYFNSLGGYHPAKLSLYNDIIQRRLSAEQNAIVQRLQTRQDSLADVHTPTANMLNAKYFIYKEGPATKAQWKNVNALGNCWFVNSIQFVKDADAEMAALGTIDPKTTAVVQESFKSSIPFQPQPDSAATIRLVKNDNDIITYTSNSTTSQFAVFSEVYYKAGWNAFIDGKETPIIKTNYVLRGLAVPAGKHTIEFKFEPQGYYKGRKLTTMATIALFALLAIAVVMEWRNRNKRVTPGETKVKTIA